MFRQLCRCGLWVIAAIVSIPPAQAQVLDRDISGAERRERAEAERQEVKRQLLVQVPATTEPNANNYVRLSPSVKSSDGAVTFGTGGQFVHDTTKSKGDGRGYFTIRPSYLTARQLEGHTHTPGVGLGTDVQLNANSDKFGQFIVSADYLYLKDRYKYGSGGVEWDLSLGDSGVTTIGSLGAARIAPGGGESASDVVPGIGFEYKTKTTLVVRLGGQYTFKNDVDQEDDFAVSIRVGLGASESVRLGTGKHGKIFASFTLTLDN